MLHFFSAYLLFSSFYELFEIFRSESRVVGDGLESEFDERSATNFNVKSDTRAYRAETVRNT